MVDLNGKLRLHSSFKCTVEHVGNERAPVLVIDNFISDAQVLIDYAAAHSEFESESDTFYPGVRAPIPAIYAFAARAFLNDVISSAFSLGDSRVAKELATFSLVTTRPECLQVLQRLPHFDNPDEKQLAPLLAPVINTSLSARSPMRYMSSSPTGDVQSPIPQLRPRQPSTMNRNEQDARLAVAGRRKSWSTRSTSH